MIDKAVRKHFKPELLNRIDGTVIFRMLSDEQLALVVQHEVEKLKSRLNTKGVDLVVTPEALAFIKKASYNPEMGARSIRRGIVTNLEDPLAEKVLLAGDDLSCITVDLKEDKLVFNEKTSKKEVKKSSEKKLIANKKS